MRYKSRRCLERIGDGTRRAKRHSGEGVRPEGGGDERRGDGLCPVGGGGEAVGRLVSRVSHEAQDGAGADAGGRRRSAAFGGERVAVLRQGGRGTRAACAAGGGGRRTGA